MKVLLLAGANSIHTVRWANGLAERGVDVHLASLHTVRHRLNERVQFHHLPFGTPVGYFAAARALRQLLEQLKPDLLNAHYASGYGTLSRLTGFEPTLLSVWGSDVYDFPEKSLLHHRLMFRNLKAATAIASTSRCMAVRTRQIYDHPQVFITPFGIDEDLFAPGAKPSDVDNVVVIGTIKTLEHKYGIDTLIRCFATASAKLGRPDDLRLEIAGGGREQSALRTLCSELGIEGQVTFHGAVPHDRVPAMLSRLDIYVALSRLDSESFGVAILEAGACGKPVVVSDADGPAEVVVDGKTGFVVPKNNAERAADKLVALIVDSDLRGRMGAAGRLHVLDHYTWKRSVDQMLLAYRQTIR